MRAWIGLGSNLGEPLAQLERAVAALATLPGTRVACVSPVYLNPALQLPEQPRQEQPDYCNAVAGIDTALTPLALLDALQAIEQAQGRTRERRWGARTLDLDLLLYANESLQTSRLTLPHPGIRARLFVLQPLHDLAPGLALPDGTAITTLLANCAPTPLRRIGQLT